ncbi:acyltransferase-domain-containing protein [Hymenopellis radicata]|nr:acyltransferase-domain-containing protein [Hymenopellis radicata]
MSFLTCLIKPLAYVSLPLVLMQSVAASSPTGRYYVRMTMYVGTLTFIATWGAAIAACMSIVGHRYDVNFVIARSFYYLASTVMNIKVEVEGTENLPSGSPAVLMVNHQSVLDILIVGKLMPRRAAIMAKSSIQFTPLGPFMILSGAIFVDRGNNARAVRSVKAAGEKMRNKRLGLWMFPEGTRHLSEQTDLLPFKKGGFHLATQADIPVLPIVVENYHWLYRKGFFGTGTIKVRVLPAVTTQGLKPEDTNDLVIRVRSQMLHTLREISVRVPPREEPSSSAVSPANSPAQSDVQKTPAVVEDVPAMSESGEAKPRAAQKAKEPSENGTEEEDEGMVLVGRPV